MLSVQVLDDGGPASAAAVPRSRWPRPAQLTSVKSATGLTEGQGTGTFTVATFTDAVGSETTGNFTVVVAWGDGTTSTITAANGLTGGSGNFAVHASHTYAEEINTATVVSVQVFDSSGPSASARSSSFNVADAPLTLTAINAPTTDAGQSTGTFAVATFTDGYTNAPLSDFTAFVSWGDGTTSTVTSAGGGITGSAGNFSVNAAHTYGSAITTATVVSVQVLDAGGSAVNGSSAPFTVAATQLP